jgi:hypothetical protein
MEPESLRLIDETACLLECGRRRRCPDERFFAENVATGIERLAGEIKMCLVRRTDVDDVRPFASKEVIEVGVSPTVEPEQLL